MKYGCVPCHGRRSRIRRIRARLWRVWTFLLHRYQLGLLLQTWCVSMWHIAYSYARFIEWTIKRMIFLCNTKSRHFRVAIANEAQLSFEHILANKHIIQKEGTFKGPTLFVYDEQISARASYLIDQMWTACCAYAQRVSECSVRATQRASNVCVCCTENGSGKRNAKYTGAVVECAHVLHRNVCLHTADDESQEWIGERDCVLQHIYISNFFSLWCVRVCIFAHAIVSMLRLKTALRAKVSASESEEMQMLALQTHTALSDHRV